MKEIKEDTNRWRNIPNEYSTQSNLQIQCNPYQATSGIFHRTRTNNFKISFLLLTLWFSISSFSNCFTCIVRLFIRLFSCFLRYDYIAMTFPLSTAFVVSRRFWVVVFSFSFISMYILILF